VARTKGSGEVASQLDYYTFMGFDSTELKRRYRGYAEQLRGFAPVLDVGCGRGEFLELLNELGIESEGVDTDAEMVAEVRKKGLRATHSDGLDFLRGHEGRFGAVFSSHVIEHMMAQQVQGLVITAAAALRPGGMLMVVAPSPRNLKMHLGEFWMDLSHVRFYSPEVVRYLMQLAGLHDIKIGENESFRMEPDGLEGGTALPQQSPRSRVIGRLREWWTRKLLPHSVILRLEDLERRVNWLDRWVRSVYPPAEFVVTGLR
jgi:O-antigen chain-terminating methyltransferase